jgi:phosphocarrier protein
MRKFDYVIKDELGIHARPAAMLVQEANKFNCKVSMACKGKETEISKLFALMTLNVQCGDTVTVTVDGPDEGDAYTAIKKFLEEKL